MLNYLKYKAFLINACIQWQNSKKNYQLLCKTYGARKENIPLKTDTYESEIATPT